MHGDRRGPDNRGPKTGRSLGFCAGNDRPGYESNEPPMGIRRGGGYGRGPGRGFGRGFRGGYPYPQNYGNDRQAEILERLDTIEEKLNKEGKK